ncbi:HBS1-like protein, partial [Stylophora pistillata]|uniref:HBS1-like protein n=1 Tax=Stylophora pistillata TaxID=50429 RepID=UPI000C03B9DA
ESDVVYVPCSGLTGENLTGSSQEPLLRAWYNGPSLLDRIDNFRPPKRDLDKPFRFCVSDIYKGMGAGINVTGKLEAGRLHVGDKIVVMPAGVQGQVKDNFRPPKRDLDKPFRFCVSDIYKGMGAGINVTGKLEAGRLHVGDKIVVMPAGVQGQVKGLSIHEEPVQLACAGDQSTLILSGLDMMHVGLGTVLCPPRSPIKCTTKLKARILVFNIRVPITIGIHGIVPLQNVK